MDIESLTERVRVAAAKGTPLVVRAGNSKAFYGGASSGEILDVSAYSGIVDYEPRELVLTVRAGTPLQVIHALLAQERQMLPFEPPQFSPASTIGGTVACGLSGPRRPYAGAVRDFLLGVRILNGRGEALRFGGRVIKNVAGYDVSRLMAGAMGTLGVLLDLSFKVLPAPVQETSLRFEWDEATALRRFNEWAGQPIPLSATAWRGGTATVRLSGTAAGVQAAAAKLGGERLNEAEAAAFWATLRDMRHPDIAGAATLWRLSVPPTTPSLDLPGTALVEWGGGLRWLAGEDTVRDVPALRQRIAAMGGHVTLFRGGQIARAAGVFHPLDPVLAGIHQRLKTAFDPAGILNPGRLDNF